MVLPVHPSDRDCTPAGVVRKGVVILEIPENEIPAIPDKPGGDCENILLRLNLYIYGNYRDSFPKI